MMGERGTSATAGVRGDRARGSGTGMALPRILVLVLAGGAGGRLELLTEQRAKPAVPFGGVYRLIDFPLSNCQHSAIADVWVSVQFHPTSLSDHLANGRPWDLDRTFGGLMMLPPFQGTERGGWVTGTAQPAVAAGGPDPPVRRPTRSSWSAPTPSTSWTTARSWRAHLDSGAEVTMVTTEVAEDDASRYGIVQVGAGGKVDGLRLQARRAGDHHRHERGLRLHARGDAGPPRGARGRARGRRARGPRQPSAAGADPRGPGPGVPAGGLLARRRHDSGVLAGPPGLPGRGAADRPRRPRLAAAHPRWPAQRRPHPAGAVVDESLVSGGTRDRRGGARVGAVTRRRGREGGDGRGLGAAARRAGAGRGDGDPRRARRPCGGRRAGRRRRGRRRHPGRPAGPRAGRQRGARRRPPARSGRRG